MYAKAGAADVLVQGYKSDEVPVPPNELLVRVPLAVLREAAERLAGT